ncbi:MAG: hypothetical protein ACOC2Q_02925 [Spirochaetota bacterium]
MVDLSPLLTSMAAGALGINLGPSEGEDEHLKILAFVSLRSGNQRQERAPAELNGDRALRGVPAERRRRAG